MWGWRGPVWYVWKLAAPFFVPMKILLLNGRAAHMRRPPPPTLPATTHQPPSLHDKPTPQERLIEHFGKQKKSKTILSLLSPGERRPKNSCCLAVYSNLRALQQTWWFTAGLNNFQHFARVIKKQVELDEFGRVMPERWPKKNMIINTKGVVKVL